MCLGRGALIASFSGTTPLVPTRATIADREAATRRRASRGSLGNGPLPTRLTVVLVDHFPNDVISHSGNGEGDEATVWSVNVPVLYKFPTGD